MWLVLSITFRIFFAIRGVLCDGLTHSNLCYRVYIVITHQNIIIIKSEVSNFPIVFIFSVVVCLRPDVVVSSYAVGFVCIPGRLAFFNFYYCAVIGYAQTTDYSMLVVFVYLHFKPLPYHHHSEGIELLNACQVHSPQRVSKIKSVLSIILHAIYGAMCIELLYLWLL